MSKIFFKPKFFFNHLSLTRKPTVSKCGPKNLQNARSQIPTYVSHLSFFSFLSGFIMSLLSTFPWKYLNNISIWCCGNFATIHTIFIWQFSLYHFYYYCYLSLIPAVKYICKYDTLFCYCFMIKYGVRQL